MEIPVYLVEHRFICTHILRATSCNTSLFTLFVHSFFKACFISTQALFFKDFTSKVNRETVSVRKLETSLTIKYVFTIFLHLLDIVIKYLHTSVDSLVKVFLLSSKKLDNIIIFFFKFSIFTLRIVHNSLNDVFKEQSVDAKQFSMTYCTS